jgi:GTP-binding protein HflX
LKDIEKERQVQRAGRKDVLKVAIVGYTNAGKSTLLNSLTQSDVYAEKKMFATLDPTSRRLRLPYDQEVIINDTVGFIRDLPEALVSAFRATLEEIADSDLLVHVVDASNPRVLQQIASVAKIIGDLHFNEIPQLIVLNKTDLLKPGDAANLTRQIANESGSQCVAISALRRETLRPMVTAIADALGTFEVYETESVAAS